MSKFSPVLALCVAMAGAVSAQAPVELKVGDKAPDFALPGTDGKTPGPKLAKLAELNVQKK